jgi:hypothetical protein
MAFTPVFSWMRKQKMVGQHSGSKPAGELNFAVILLQHPRDEELAEFLMGARDLTCASFYQPVDERLLKKLPAHERY